MGAVHVHVGQSLLSLDHLNGEEESWNYLKVG